MPLLKFAEVIAELRHVDDSDVLDRAQTNPALRMALEMVRPPNWWGVGIDPNLLFTIAQVEGIPLAWVPRESIVAELGSAADALARRGILVDRQNEILSDCSEVLAQCNDPWLGDAVVLTRKAVDAYHGGHHEAAMALAVSIGEPLAAWASTPRVRGFESEEDKNAWKKSRQEMGKYAWAEYELGAVGVDVSRLAFKQQLLMAPVARFFTKWYPGIGAPIPKELSRHIVAHQPSLAHFSVDNALVSVMLVVSILRDQQAWSEEVRSMELESGD